MSASRRAIEAASFADFAASFEAEQALGDIPPL